MYFFFCCFRGSFEILRAKTQASESFKGVQAHFSTHVSPKVCEVVAKFSDKLKLEEVPWNTAWPMQFQKIEPSEEHVALFFFARDLERFTQYFIFFARSSCTENRFSFLCFDIFRIQCIVKNHAPNHDFWLLLFCLPQQILKSFITGKYLLESMGELFLTSLFAATFFKKEKTG